MKKPIKNVLFITWDGPDTQYLERLFLPIFHGLKQHGYVFHVLQFGWGSADKFEQRSFACRQLNIPYQSIKVSRSLGTLGPFSTAYLGKKAIKKAVINWDIDTLMPRSLMPALAVLSMPKADRDELNVIFDADGLAADERVDFAGVSSTSITYRLLRDIEMQMLCQADAVLTRTEAAKQVLLARAGSALEPKSCYCISNGVDATSFVNVFNAFLKQPRSEFVLCYCGSIGPQYRLPEMLDIAVKIKKCVPNLKFKLFTPAITEIEKQLTIKNLVSETWIEYRSLAATEVPYELVKCDLGFALREPKFSTQGVLPIKLGEYLLSGLPVIGTPNVGNTIELEGLGVFHSIEENDFAKTLDWILNEYIPNQRQWRQECHRAGMHYYDINSTVQQYAIALSSI